MKSYHITCAGIVTMAVLSPIHVATGNYTAFVLFLAAQIWGISRLRGLVAICRAVDALKQHECSPTEENLETVERELNCAVPFLDQGTRAEAKNLIEKIRNRG